MPLRFASALAIASVTLLAACGDDASSASAGAGGAGGAGSGPGPTGSSAGGAPSSGSGDPCASCDAEPGDVADLESAIGAMTEAVIARHAELARECTEGLEAVGEEPEEVPGETPLEAADRSCRALGVAIAGLVSQVGGSQCGSDRQVVLDCEEACACEACPDRGAAIECAAASFGSCAATCAGVCVPAPEGVIACEGTCFGLCRGTCDGIASDSLPCEGVCGGTCDGPCAQGAGADVACEGTCAGECSVELDVEGCEAWELEQTTECLPCSRTCALVAMASEICQPVGVLAPSLGGPAMEAISEAVGVCAAVGRAVEAGIGLGDAIGAEEATCVASLAAGLEALVAELDGAAAACAPLFAGLE
jgi:hypothetical protein